MQCFFLRQSCLMHESHLNISKNCFSNFLPGKCLQYIIFIKASTLFWNVWSGTAHEINTDQRTTVPFRVECVFIWHSSAYVYVKRYGH